MNCNGSAAVTGSAESPAPDSTPLLLLLGAADTSALTGLARRLSVELRGQ